MKKLFSVILFLVFAKVSIGQSGQNTITFSTIAQMQAYGGAYGQARVLDTMRGGVFNRIPKGILPVDSGVVLNSGNVNYVWVRDYTQKRAVNVRWWGGIGGGLGTYKQDSAAITMALKYLITRGGGALYFPSTTSFYGFNGNGILVPDNIEIFGDGVQSEVRHVNPESTLYFPGCIFFTGTYGSRNPSSIFKPGVLKYTFKPVSAGANYIVLNSIADTANFQIGEVFVLGSQQFFKKADTAKKRYLQTEMIEVAKIHLDTVFTTFALTSNFTYDAAVGSDPLALEVNSGATTNPNLGVADHCSKNVSIHDLTLSQADYNMITNTPYNNTRVPYNVIGLGETFNSQFYNLTLSGYGTFGGNMFNQCNVHDITINGAKKLFDFGYGTANSTFNNIRWTYLPTAIIGDTVAFIYADDAMHNCDIGNISAVGQWTGNNIIQITGGTYNLNIHDLNFNLPSYHDTSRSIIRMDDDGSTILVKNIAISNFKLNVDSIGQWIKFTGDAAAPSARGISFNNLIFTGTALDGTDAEIYLRNAGNLEFTNCSFFSGDSIYARALTGAVIANVQIPSAKFYSHLSTTLALYNNNFKSSNYAAITPVPPSAAPTTLKNGQIYNTGTHLYVVINGTSYQLDQQGGGGGVTTLYNGDGTLSGNRIVSGGNHNLSFTDNSVFLAEGGADNNKYLAINNTLGIFRHQNFNGIAEIQIDGGTPSIQSYASNLINGHESTFQVNAENVWALPHANFGIGTSTPAYALDVVGNGHFTAPVYFGTGGQNISRGSFDNGTSGDNGISLNCAVGYEFNWQGGKATVKNGGTTVPFELNSPLKIVDGTEAAGRILVCDATGLASWQDNTVALEDGSGTTHDGNKVNLGGTLTTNADVNADGYEFNIEGASAISLKTSSGYRIDLGGVDGITRWNSEGKITTYSGSEAGAGALLVGDGTKFNAINITGDISIDGDGFATVTSAAPTWQEVLNTTNGNKLTQDNSIDMQGNTLNFSGDLSINSLKVGNGEGGFNSSNTMLGNGVLQNNTTGQYNTSVGLQSSNANTTGFGNTSIGNTSLYSNTTGQYNTSLGYQSLVYNTTGHNNTALGVNSLYKTNGNYNIGIGRDAGLFIADGVTQLTSSSNSLFLGYNTKALGQSQTNQIVIGHDATGLGSNTTTIGNSSTTITQLRGTLKLPTYSSAQSGTAVYALNVDASGNVITGSVASSNWQVPITAGDVTTSGATSTIGAAKVSVSKMSLPSYSFAANNTNATAAPTAFTYKAPGVQTYTGTVTWTGTTAPYGTTNVTYDWVQIGNQVNVTIWAAYTGQGNFNTQVDFTFPTDMPAPIEPAGLTATNDIIATGVGSLNSSSSNLVTTARHAYLIKTGTGTYKISVVAPSTQTRVATANIVYYIN